MHSNYIGRSIIRVDAQDKVTGNSLYPGDFSRKGMLYMKILFAPCPHARVIKVTTTRSQSIPGVVGFLTSLDVPVNEYGLQFPDQPVLCGPGGDKEGSDIVRFLGDQVAAVVAETEEAAERARDLIEVEYKELPIVASARDALKPGAKRLHPQYSRVPNHPELVFEGNIVSRHCIRRGNIEEAFSRAHVIVESEYDIPGQEHVFLQPEAGIGYIDDNGRITVVVSGQWPHIDQEQIAHALNVPTDRVRVIYPAIGGAFGGREDISIQIVLALAARKFLRPVKIVWTRKESIIGHCKRHRIFARARWAAASNGKLLGAECKVLGDAGAYLYTSNKVMGNVFLMCNGPYKIPAVKTDVISAYTNNIPGGAFRGFGAPQANFIAESQINKLAEKLHLDPVEIRLRNIVHKGDPMPWGHSLPDDARGLEDSLIAAAQAVGWTNTTHGWQKPEPKKETRDPSYLKHGVGIALGLKGVGYSFGYPENAWVGLELSGTDKIEQAHVFVACSEVGQGTRTVILQMAAQALNMPVSKIHLEPVDTSSAKSAGPASASRLTFMAGNAVRSAADLAIKEWQQGARPATSEYTYFAPPTTQADPETGYCNPTLSHGYMAIGVEVALDKDLGICRFPKIVCANDVGRAINPKLVQGQIEGGVVQGVGWASTENFIEQEAIPATDSLTTYLIPTIADIPDKVEAICIENAETNGPWGARGMGEMPFVPVASAIHHAIRDATGEWIDSFPFTPERIVRVLRNKI